MDPVTFSLNDRAGKPHDYVLLAHLPAEGFKLACAVQDVVVGPLAVLAKGAGGSPALLDVIDRLMADEAEAKSDPAIAEVVAALLGLDLDALVAAVRKALAGCEDMVLIHALLARMTRDGKPLSDPAVFDAAYAGNLGEMMKAVGRSAGVNGFFTLPGI